MFRSIRGALAAGRDRFDFRLVHFSVQRNHLHLLAEAGDRRALSRGVQGLAIRVAKAINRKTERHGKVFGDRYHVRALKTPRETRFALRYVLLDANKHERGSDRVPVGFADRCSSAPWFDGWSRPRALVFTTTDRGRDPPIVAPRTWLLRVGWRRGGPLDADDAPATA